MSFMFLILGVMCSKLSKRLFNYEFRGVHSLISAGMIAATVYAEYFSIVYKVSVLAFLILFLICCVGVVICFKDIKRSFGNFSGHLRSAAKSVRLIDLLLFLISLCTMLVGAYIASKDGSTGGYDTPNYHIPSIRWISEYGVVKGLANLHTRFAYNSAFLCLQALFSFRNLLGYSLHSVDGFIWVFMFLYCFWNLWVIERRRFALSDLLRLIFMFLLVDQIKGISAPSTDFWPMCITAYIFIEWCDLVEKPEDNPVPYGLLAMYGLFSLSVKLSSSILFLFAIKPVLEFIKSKKPLQILKFAVIGLLLILPYLIRNVILCGYLLYPVAAIDLFNFDWKVPKSVIVAEKIGIEIFARAWGADNGYVDWSESFGQWFEIWIQYSSGFYGALGISNLILSIIVLVYSVYKIVKNRVLSYGAMIPVVSCSGFLFLIYSAPSVRFGRWWFASLPFIVTFYLAKRIHKGRGYEELPVKSEPKEPADIRGVIYFWGLLLLFLVDFFAAFIIKDLEHHTPGWIEALLVKPADYNMNGTSGQYYDMNGYRFYYYLPNPTGVNCLNGYAGFPGTETLYTLSRIEMRGESLADGFRPKPECRDIPYDGLGHVIADEFLPSMGLDKYYKSGYTDNYADAVCARKSDEDISKYDTCNDLVYSIEGDEVDEAGLRVIYGWAYASDADDLAYGDIYVRFGDNYYKCDEIVCYDVAEGLGDRGAKIGFAVYTQEKGDAKVCIVDDETMTLHCAQ